MEFKKWICKAFRFIGLRVNSKHIRAFIKHNSKKKLQNLILACLEFRQSKVALDSFPFILNIEPINACNLRCPLCPTGAGEHGRPPRKMDFSEFKRIIDKIGGYLYEVNLYDFGEPFLNEDIALMIEYANKKNISTCVGTNATLLDERISEALVRSRLDHLSLSIDGLSSETYSKYRIGGDFGKVIENLKRIVNWKRKLNSFLPFIEWQFLVFKHNQHEVGKVKQFARGLGADGVYIRSARSSADVQSRDENLNFILGPGEKMRKEYPEEEIGGGKACDFLYFTFTLNPKGGVSPCCLAYREEDDFDNLYQRELSFREVWNNERFRAARYIFNERRLSLNTDILCNVCRVTKDFLQNYNKDSLLYR